jgi:hypothetical protein
MTGRFSNIPEELVISFFWKMKNENADILETLSNQPTVTWFRVKQVKHDYQITTVKD